VTELEQLIATLRARIADLEAHARQTEDVNIMKRWLSVWLVVDGCHGSDVFFYVRSESKLENMEDKRPVEDAKKFNADEVIRSSGPDYSERTLLFGHRYYDISISGSGSAMQVKVFNAVARSGDRASPFSIYIMLKNPASFSDRSCNVHPIFISHQGTVFGQALSLSILRPFSWIKQFEMRGDGTNSLSLSLTESAHAALLAFSREQSTKLCHADKVSICGTEDALLHAIRAKQFARADRLGSFAFERYPRMQYQYSKDSKTQKAADREECERRCGASATCASYTYFKKSSDPTKSQYCRLMENAGHEIWHSEDAESGAKIAR
jgi:hypothetical protein